jgi:adenine-specific DNA-methyltransferase
MGPLDEETASRLLTLPATVGAPVEPPTETLTALDEISSARQDAVQREISKRNSRFFETEAEKLDGWADDLKLGLEREIKDIDRQIKETRRVATAALTLEEKLSGQKQIKALEAQRSQKRRSLFDSQDDVDRRREQLISQIEGKLRQQNHKQQLFLIRWVLAS